MKTVVKKKSTKNAFDGDILQACKLTDDTINDILAAPGKRKRKRTTSRDDSFDNDMYDQYREPARNNISRIRISEKPKTVSFVQNRNIGSSHNELPK